MKIIQLLSYCNVLKAFKCPLQFREPQPIYSSVGFLSFLVLFYYGRREGVASFDLSGLFKIWVSAILMFLGVYTFSDFIGHSLILLPLYIGTGAILYFVLSKMLGIFRGESKELILSLFPDRYMAFKKLLMFLVLH